MNLSIGIVGLPNAGKSSLFKALTAERIPIEKYPFTTIKPHHGIVHVPDPMLEKLGAFTPSNLVLPAVIEFVDIAGLIRGAHRGEGLGNQFLSHIRETAAIIEVVRAFPDPTVPHPEGTVDPDRDIETIDLELCMADFETAARALGTWEHEAKKGTKGAAEMLRTLAKTHGALKQGTPLRKVLTREEAYRVKEFNFLTAKPILFVLNIDEHVLMPSDEFTVLPAKLLAELVDLPEEDRAAVLKESGYAEHPLLGLIRKAFEMLDLITFYTVKPPETRAWLVKKGATLPEAGGAIHTDFEEKFIKAEVVPAAVLLSFKNWHEAKTRGKVLLEGRNYIVQNEDVIEFKI